VGKEIVVYFDPGLAYHAPERRSEVGITIRRASIGQQADDLIIQDVQRNNRPRELIVVTSDRAIQQVAARRGCQVVDAVAFLADMGRPARKKPRRARAATVREPRLSSEEVKEWLRVFRRSAK
jgi:predicted RNA-binding protein with PIN domain